MDRAESKQICKYVNTKLGEKGEKGGRSPVNMRKRLWAQAGRTYARLDLKRQLQRCAVAAALLRLLYLYVLALSPPLFLPI